MATDCVVERCCQCGKYHERPNGSRFENFFCSRECSYKFKRHLGAHRDCTCCGKQIWCTSRKSKQRKVFCGNDCLLAFRKANRDAKQSVPKERKPPVSKGHVTYGEWWPTWMRLRTRGTIKAYDPWIAKLFAIAHGWNDRGQDIQRPRCIRPSVVPTGWRMALERASVKARRKLLRLNKKNADPWWVKIETMTRRFNQMRLLNDWKQNESCPTAIDAGVSRVQMRVEWSGLNA